MTKKQYNSKIEDLTRSMNGLQFATIAQLHEQKDTIKYPMSMQDKEELLKEVLPYNDEIPMLTLVMNSMGHIHVFYGEVNDYLYFSNKQNITKKVPNEEIAQSEWYYQSEDEINACLEHLSPDDRDCLNRDYVINVKNWGIQYEE